MTTPLGSNEFSLLLAVPDPLAEGPPMKQSSEALRQVQVDVVTGSAANDSRLTLADTEPTERRHWSLHIVNISYVTPAHATSSEAIPNLQTLAIREHGHAYQPKAISEKHKTPNRTDDQACTA